ncbi:uncharacterized protein EKO05_0006207 [Ascochyta rabiei]|uniref:Uncharacterized protein n=1 Tax=Didymella rabiei TaxID=5454 RepID=A0A163AX17_DIDRA|nr:uncharacterized protein EKO05_0006207 [Ascochyta rabiei]KZM21444.1 hypothetical protein ST47_g7420 [Ascochyta rabiei]UPX15768.1 hypothetical protein EKO05_0006207 [Ascochyta rabiei]
MSYTDHDRHHRPRHATLSSRPRDSDPYAPRYAPPSAPREKPSMRDSVNRYPSSSYHGPYDAREPRTWAAPPRYRTSTRKATWPPSPAVEEESVAAGKELSSSVGPQEGEPPINTRGTVDQEFLLDEIEQPRPGDSDERRFVFVSAPGADGLHAASGPGGARRKSFAERGNMPHLKTHVESDPPLFTKRVSTPYSYTPQKESTAPASAAFVLSPEPLTPANTSKPRTVSSRDTWDAQKDQNARPSKSIPVRTRRHSPARPAPHSAKDDVFDDSASDGESTTHLRTNERKPARYSFVKSDAQKEDLRTYLRENQPRPEPSRRDSTQRPPTARAAHHNSSGSSKESSYYQSPRSSSSSVNSEKRKSRPAPVDTTHVSTSRPSSRPSSPLHSAASPKMPSRLRQSPPGSRPSSRGNAARPASPLAWATTVSPPSPRQLPITDADWHATYPPVSATDRPRPQSRFGRHETIQIPPPRVDVQSPSPVRPPTSNPLPYPVDDHHVDVWMPGEEQYQFDHSTVPPPRQIFRDAPRVASPSISNSPRQTDGFPRSSRPRTPRPEEAPRLRRSRSNSVDSKHSSDGRTKSSRTAARLDRPLPSCPRGTPTDRYDDWYSLPGYRNFDICPSCYDGVFADTPFSAHFSQPRRHERPTERFCDFSSPWMRLAWLLTIKQRRPSLDLLYALADISDSDRPCPGDRELSTDRVSWYGIPDQRDGLHVANFAVCSADVKMLEILFPTVRGYFTRLPSTSAYSPEKHTCSLRVSSRRFPKYLDLLVELDAEAQSTASRPNMTRFVKMARENAFKGECARGKAFVRKAWHFIPQLPEFTVCEECYDEVIWPALSKPSPLPRLVNKSIQLVPNEDLEFGSSCALYSARMRRVWDVCVKDDDIKYLERKVLERKRKEILLAKERRGILQWLALQEKGSRGYERAKDELRQLDREWKECE